MQVEHDHSEIDFVQDQKSIYFRERRQNPVSTDNIYNFQCQSDFTVHVKKQKYGSHCQEKQ